MPHYRWTGDGPFRDGRNDRVVESGDVVELPEHAGEPNSELVRVEVGNDDEGEPFDPDEWLDQDYQDRAARVRDGEVDEHLDTIADIETSQTVQDAVAERQQS